MGEELVLFVFSNGICNDLFLGLFVLWDCVWKYFFGVSWLCCFDGLFVVEIFVVD